MNKLRQHFECFKYLARHKWYVLQEAVRLGIPLRGLTHDLSKLLPSEWFPYVEMFYGNGKNDKEFDAAWLHHQHWNSHHWQHWVLRNDDGTTRILEMPLTDRKEMFADWIGAAKASGNTTHILNWYIKNYYNLQLGPETRRWIETEIHLYELGVAYQTRLIELANNLDGCEYNFLEIKPHVVTPIVHWGSQYVGGLAVAVNTAMYQRIRNTSPVRQGNHLFEVFAQGKYFGCPDRELIILLIQRKDLIPRS